MANRWTEEDRRDNWRRNAGVRRDEQFRSAPDDRGSPYRGDDYTRDENGGRNRVRDIELEHAYGRGSNRDWRNDDDRRGGFSGRREDLNPRGGRSGGEGGYRDYEQHNRFGESGGRDWERQAPSGRYPDARSGDDRSSRGQGLGSSEFEAESLRGGRGEAGFSGESFRGKGPKNYSRTDDRILEDVNERLSEDHFVDASEIEVAVKSGEVTLSGHVSNRDQRRRAEDIAEGASGVKHVQNNIRIGTGPQTGAERTGAAAKGEDNRKTTSGRSQTQA